MEALVQEELNRINALSVQSEFENLVKSDIMIWGYQQNINRLGNGLSIIKYDTFKELAIAYWNEKSSSFGKLRAIR
jgi:hypothetical protein